MEFQYQIGAEVKAVHLERAGEIIRAKIGDRVVEAHVLRQQAGELTLVIEGEQLTAYMAENGSTRYVFIGGEVFELKRPDPHRPRRKHYHGEDRLSASMPGQVTKVLVNAGDHVQRGQALLVLEAMKMEIKVTASGDGRVAQVLVTVGQVVDRGQGLIEMVNEQQSNPTPL